MREAEHPERGTMFIDRGTRIFRGSASLHPRKVIHGVGRGYQLVHNAQKWTRPEVGPGSEKSRRARGQQWRLVMAYAGFEILAKSLQGNFAVQGGPGVERFLGHLGDFSHREVPIPAGRRIPKGKTPADMLDFLRTHKGDRLLLEAWMDSAGLHEKFIAWPRINGISLARVMRNLTAHGILSASLARRLNIPALCDVLTIVLAEAARHALSECMRAAATGGVLPQHNHNTPLYEQ